MLSRVAESLYWMSRYLERAEHTARLLDLNLNLMLDQAPDPDGEHPLLARLKHRDFRLPDYRSVSADHSLSRCLRKLVQPNRGACRPHSIKVQRGRKRYGQTGRNCYLCGAARGRRFAGRDSGLPTGQPILRNGSAVRGGLAAIRSVAAGMDSGSGHLRLCP